MPRLASLALPCALLGLALGPACAKPKSAPAENMAPADAAEPAQMEEEQAAEPASVDEEVGGLREEAGKKSKRKSASSADADAAAAPAAPPGAGPEASGGGGGGLEVRVPAINGGLHRDIIRRTAGTHEAAIRGCVPPALAANPALREVLTLELDYEGDGRVSAAKVPEGSPFTLDAVEDCVRELAEGWQFPAPEHGEAGQLTLELQL